MVCFIIVLGLYLLFLVFVPWVALTLLAVWFDLMGLWGSCADSLSCGFTCCWCITLWWFLDLNLWMVF